MNSTLAIISTIHYYLKNHLRGWRFVLVCRGLVLRFIPVSIAWPLLLFLYDLLNVCAGTQRNWVEHYITLERAIMQLAKHKLVSGSCEKDIFALNEMIYGKACNQKARTLFI